MTTLAKTPRLVTLGETLGVIASTRPGHFGPDMVTRLGIAGSESNVAIGVRRLGAAATWIGHVGTDPFGQLILRELRAEGVDAVVTEEQQFPTGLMIREQRTHGFANVTYHRAGSAGSKLSLKDIPDDVLGNADILHITGITAALGQGPGAAVDRIVSMAVETGVVVSLDINYRANLWSREAAAVALRPLVAKADIVFASEQEAALFTAPAKPEVMARALQSIGPATAIIKMGKRGCWAAIGDLDMPQEARNTEVVDTVGAGDAFAAGYLAELMARCTPAQCLATAATMGAFAVSTVGDWEGLPRRDELSIFESDDDTRR